MHSVDRTEIVLTHEADSPRDQTTAFYEAIVPHGYIGWGKTTQLGTSLGLLQGAILARPGPTGPASISWVMRRSAWSASRTKQTAEFAGVNFSGYWL